VISAHVQIAIVGGGPAGLAAAAEAHGAGARALLIEERPVLGGRAVIVPGARGLADGLVRNLRSTEVWRSSPVWGLFGRTLAVMRAGRPCTVNADAVILATGAVEQLLPFPGWTLEGVMTIEGGWEAIRSGKVGPGSGPAVVVGGSEGSGLATRLAERGVAVLLMNANRPKDLPERIPVIPGALSEALGTMAIERVVLSDGSEHRCRMLCIESPRAPLTELIRLVGTPCVYQPRLGGFVPRYDRTMALHGPTTGLYVAGDCAGVDTPRAAAESGRLAARSALRSLALLPEPEGKIDESWQLLRALSAPLCARARESLVIGAMPDDVTETWDGPSETIFCPCEGVTAGDLRAALNNGALNADDLKRETRCGMGACQWRRCGGSVMRWLSGALKVPVGRLPLPRVRPPTRPLPLAVLAEMADAAPQVWDDAKAPPLG
jgi:octopine oxidase subunit A